VPFKSILRDLVQSTPGLTGAILTDWEGEAIEYFSLSDDEFALKILGAHQNIILNRLREIHNGDEPRVFCEAVISTDRQHIVIGAVGADYSLVAVVDRAALLGRALYHIRHSLKVLEKEIY
jgi:predicted regulator of Ras-like GTPase activity (Roadblock/LC7/MglB family)